MCGIAGFLLHRHPGGEPDAILATMSAAIRHRGPDGAGTWFDAATGVGLAHRRLAIIDLSEGGAQPMRSASGRFTVVYNGEIYNYRELRRELAGAGAAFRTQSDTEVMLAAFERWGVIEALPRLAGMFALAVWDGRDAVLTLARDRVGKKPLYHGVIGGNFVFASELRGLQCVPGFEAAIDRGSLATLLRQGNVPAPASIFSSIAKLEPATAMTVRATAGGLALHAQRYWDARAVYADGMRNPQAVSHAQIVQGAQEVLTGAVRIRMIADVPLGAFLSGGLDSTVVAALMQRQSAAPVRSFTIGFEAGHDEAPFARAVARHLGTAHEELYVSTREVLDLVPAMPQVYDEPFADYSQIPTFAIARLARARVTVALSGDGGDEVFGGYNRYLWTRRFWPKLSLIPASLRRAVAAMLRYWSPSQWDEAAKLLNGLLPQSQQLNQLGLKTRKAADVADAADVAQIYDRLTRLESSLDNAVLHAGAGAGHMAPAQFAGDDLDGQVQQMMLGDLLGYLPDDILVKVDRASMAVALETRAPFLDHRVIEYMARVPVSEKFAGGRPKAVLRAILAPLVPAELVERPKAGFNPPLEHWLRGPLRDWAAALIDPARLRREGFFDPAPIDRLWAGHQSGTGNWQFQLWPVLMFQAWLERQRDSRATE